MSLFMFMALISVATSLKACDEQKKALPLLRWSLSKSDNKIHIEAVEETLKAIQGIDTPISVLSIMGPYRSGER